MKTDGTRNSFPAIKPKGDPDKAPSAVNDPPPLCFKCCVARNMGMAVEVLQTSKLLLHRNAPKAQVVRGINIARAMIQDVVEHFGSDHRMH